MNVSGDFLLLGYFSTRYLQLQKPINGFVFPKGTLDRYN